MSKALSSAKPVGVRYSASLSPYGCPHGSACLPVHTSGVESRAAVTSEAAASATPQEVLSGRSLLVRHGGRAVAATSLLTVCAMLAPNDAQGFTADVANTTASNEVVSNGTQIVFLTGSAVSGTIENNGTQEVLGGYTSAMTVNSGGIQNISGGSAYDTAVNSGGVQNVSSGGSATRTGVNSGGVQNVKSGGSAYDTDVNSGGVQNVSSGGSATRTIVNSGGVQNVFNGGSDINALLNDGSVQNVFNGGTATSATVTAGSVQNVSNGGTANETLVTADGVQNVSNGGTAISTFLDAASVQNVSNGGTAIGTVVAAGGVQNVSNGGTANETRVTDNGYQYVYNGGTATSATVDDNGQQYVESGGTAISTTVDYGGYLNVDGGGILAGGVVSSGGHLVQTTGQGILASGTVEIRDGADFDAASLKLEQGATLLMETNGTLPFTTELAGEGALYKDGTGTLEISSILNNAGGLAVNEGTAVLLPGAKLTGLAGANSGGTLDLGGEPQTIAGMWGDSDGEITYGAGDLTVNVSSGAVHVYSGALAGPGTFVKTGNGSQIFNGSANSTGPVSVSGGSLIVGSDPSYSAVHVAPGFTVYSGGVLGGHGTLTGDVIIKVNGAFSPGASIGTTTVDGNMTYEPGSFLDIEHDTDTGAYDSVKITGTADLAGTVRLIPLGTGTVGLTDAPILTAAGGVSSEFDNLEAGTFWDASLSYDANNVYLNATPLPDPAPAEYTAYTRNQRAVNNALATIGPSGELYAKLLSVSGISRPEMLNKLSGEIYPTALGGMLSLDRDFSTLLMRRAGKITVLDRAAQALYAETGPQDLATSSGFPRHHGLWVSGGGSYSRIASTGNTARATFSGPEVHAGYDLSLADGWFGGLALRYSFKDLDVKGGRGSDADINSYSLALFGGKEFDLGPGAFRLMLGAAYTRHDIEVDRKIRVPGMRETLEGDYDADSWQAFLEGAYALPVARHLWLEPFANLTWNRVEADSFRETGGTAALKVRSKDKDVTASQAGLRAQVPLHERVNLNAEAGWRHTYGKVKPTTRMAFRDSGDSFTITGASMSRDEAVLNLNVEIKATDNLSFGISYDGTYGDRGQSHGGHAFVAFRF